MPTPSSLEKRNQPRAALQLRVDAKVLDEIHRQDILTGLGYPELDQESLALTRPRRGRCLGHTRDISHSGLGLDLPLEVAGHCAGSLQQGDSLELDLHLPGERRVVKLLAEVIWARKDGEALRTGVRFSALEDEGMRRLRSYLREKRSEG